MSRIVHLLDRLIDAAVIAVLVFTPLAYGAVQEWARSAAQIAVWLLFAAWLVKLAWTPANPRRKSARTLLGGRVRLSGLELPGLLFALLLVVQLIPLPPSVIETISPRTAEIHRQTLPPDFADMPVWLQADPDPRIGDIAGLPPDPETAAAAFPAEWFEVEQRAWRPLSLTPSDTRRALAVFLAHLAMFVVVFNRFDRTRGPRVYAIVLTVLAAALSTLGLLQTLAPERGIYGIPRTGTHAGFGPFVNANNFAGWMEMALPLAAALALWYGLRRSRQGWVARTPALAFGFATILGLASFLLAQSRGGLLALLGALLITLAVWASAGRVRGKAVVFALVPLLLAIGLASWIDLPGVADRYGTLADFPDERSFTTRVDYTRRALTIGADFPLFGSGLGTFREAHDLYTPGTSSRELARAHNDYAQLLAEGGLVGGIAAVWALAVLLWRGVRGGLRRPPAESGWIAPAAAVGVLAMLLHSFVDFNLQIYSNSMLFVVLCAVLLHLAGQERETRP